MTKSNSKLRKEQFFDICMKIEMSSQEILDRVQQIRKILKMKGKKTQCFNGRGLISMFLPDTLIYERKNDGCPEEPVIKIYRGVLYEGVINKEVVGSSHNSLIQVINKEYGCDAAASFIDHIQFVTNNWLMISGFSVGIEDCMVPEGCNEAGVTKVQQIEDVIQRCYIEAEGIKTTTAHPGIREIRVGAVLSKAKDIGLRIAKDGLREDNNFLSTVYSGSKGDFFNIAQVTGLLGQQSLKGQRVPQTLNHGKRTLPHYPFGELPVEMEYESRGFIARSFIQGLTPRQVYFHAMSGREGVCDTANGTAKSGYMQRKITKLTEDMCTVYDGTVRDKVGTIYQMAYGDDGLNPTKTVKVGAAQEACDISRLVARMNLEHEMSRDKVRGKAK